MLARTRRPGSSWKWIETKAKALELAERRNAANHGGEVLMFVNAAEKGSEDMLNMLKMLMMLKMSNYVEIVLKR